MCVESVYGQVAAFTRGLRPALSFCPEACGIGGFSAPGVLGCEQPTRLASSDGEDTRPAAVCQPTRAGLQPLFMIVDTTQRCSRSRASHRCAGCVRLGDGYALKGTKPVPVLVAKETRCSPSPPR